MSSATPASAESAPAAPKPAKAKGGGIGMLLAAVVLSVAASGGVSFFMSKKIASAATSEGEAGEPAESEAGEAAEPLAAANYLALDPAFVANLEDPDQPRFLQAEIQVMSRDALALEGVKTHLPRIRSALLMLLGQQKPADLTTREGKEKLMEAVLAEVQKVMQVETGKPAVEAVYFTSFVMQ